MPRGIIERGSWQVPFVAQVTQCAQFQNLTANVSGITPVKKVEILRLSTLYGHACVSGIPIPVSELCLSVYLLCGCPLNMNMCESLYPVSVVYSISGKLHLPHRRPSDSPNYVVSLPLVIICLQFLKFSRKCNIQHTIPLFFRNTFCL